MQPKQLLRLGIARLRLSTVVHAEGTVACGKRFPRPTGGRNQLGMSLPAPRDLDSVAEQLQDRLEALGCGPLAAG